MRVEQLQQCIGADFYVGVPDSQLKALCDALMSEYGVDPEHHIIAANEGNAAGLAVGYHLATGRIPVVYMQNSGLGNIINPVASLLNDNVYGIPCLFIIGWRGEPGVRDEPQHIYQGKVTIRLLEDMNIRPFVIGCDTTEEELRSAVDSFQPLLEKGGQAALLVRKGALQYGGKTEYKNGYSLTREELIRLVVNTAGDDVLVSTTGKTSRELFEIRESDGSGHGHDFLTVGSMGHSSSIALGIAAQKPDRKIWVLDGDGAALMHLGAMALIGAQKPRNLVHIVIRNEAHESVGGMPTAGVGIRLSKIAEDCGYPYAVCAGSPGTARRELAAAKERDALTFIEVKCAIGARKNLGRPTETPLENKEAFMRFLST